MVNKAMFQTKLQDSACQCTGAGARTAVACHRRRHRRLQLYELLMRLVQQEAQELLRVLLLLVRHRPVRLEGQHLGQRG